MGVFFSQQEQLKSKSDKQQQNQPSALTKQSTQIKQDALNKQIHQAEELTQNTSCFQIFYHKIISKYPIKKAQSHIKLTQAAEQTLKQISLREHQKKVTNLNSTVYYFEDLNATYQGKFIDGLPHGQGIAHFNDGSFYSGYFRFGQAYGIGIYIYSDGSIYQGRFQNSWFHGYGALCYKRNKLRFVGDFIRGKPHGIGQQIYENGERYIGQFRNGKKQGEAIYKWPNGQILEGTFKNGVINGYGKLRKANKIIYQGQFENGLKNGLGRLYTEDADYEGFFKNDYLEGNGKIYWKNGIMYSGNFVKSKLHGEGKIIYPDQKISQAVWYNNQLRYSGQPQILISSQETNTNNVINQADKNLAPETELVYQLNNNI